MYFIWNVYVYICCFSCLINPFPLMNIYFLFVFLFILASKDYVAGSGELRLNFYALLPESNQLDLYCNEDEYLCRIQATFCVRFDLTDEMFHCDSPNIKLVNAGVNKVGESYGIIFNESLSYSGQYVLLETENDFDGNFELYSKIETYNSSSGSNLLYSRGYYRSHIQSSGVAQIGVIQDTLGPHKVNITFSYELICSNDFIGMYCNIECSSVPCTNNESPNIISPLNTSTIVVNISTSSYNIINCQVTGNVDGVYWLDSDLQLVSNDHILFIGLETLHSISEDQTYYCYAYNANDLVYITVDIEVVGWNRTTVEILNDFREGISEEEYLDENSLDFFNEYLLSATGELYTQLEHEYTNRLSQSLTHNLQFDDSYYFSEGTYQELYDISYTYQNLVDRFTTNYNVLQQKDITTSLLNTADGILKVSTRPTKLLNQTTTKGSYLFVTETTNMAFNALESISVNIADNIEIYQESNIFSLAYGSISVHARHWLRSELAIDQSIQLEYSSQPLNSIVIPIELVNQIDGSNDDMFSIVATIVDTHNYSKFEATNEIDPQIASQTVQIVLPRNYINSSQSPFSMPIKITFNVQTLDNSDYRFKCVFLNTTTLQWSTNDVTTGSISNQSSVDCYTTHLTNFAVLVSPYQPAEVDFNHIASEYVGYALGSLSTICLLISLILFIAAGKNFFKIEANVVYFNCCLAMFIAMTLYLFTSQTFTFNRYLCMVVAFLLHYTWLALFFWMLCIGLLILYSVTIGIFRKRRIYPTLFIIGWILPMIIPIVTLGVGFDIYIDQNLTYCFIGGELIYAFIGPVYVIIFINFIIFCITLYRIFFALKKSNNYKTGEISKKTIITGFTLTPILGLPWGLTIIGVFTNHSILHWLHSTLSGSLGIIFFLVVVLLNDEVQELLCKTRTRRKKRLTKKSFISSNSNSTPMYRPRARNSKLQREESMNQTTPTSSITKIPEEIQEDHANTRDIEAGEVFSNSPSSSNGSNNCITSSEQIF